MQAIRNPVDGAKFTALVIRGHVPDTSYRVVLFGLRATGSAGERSDIDIGIEGPTPVSRAALAAIHDGSRKHRRSRAFRRNFAGSQSIGLAVTKPQSLRADFEKAMARLDEALALPKDPIVRDSAI
jgi:Nucleotidyltransferase domain